MSNPMIEKMIQFTHLDKLYGYLPGMAEAQPAIFGIDPASYTELIARFDAQARQTAQQLLADDGFAGRVDALPFRRDQSVLAVGDSITDDLQSWAEILRHLLDLQRPGHGVRVVNAGLSAHTTAMMLRRWPATLAQHPDWILCLLGGNDVTRVGPEPTKPQVSLDESVANLRELRRIATADTSWVWITPAPVHEDRVAEFPPFRFGASSWRNADILALAAGSAARRVRPARGCGPVDPARRAGYLPDPVPTSRRSRRRRLARRGQLLRPGDGRFSAQSAFTGPCAVDAVPVFRRRPR